MDQLDEDLKSLSLSLSVLLDDIENYMPKKEKQRHQFSLVDNLGSEFLVSPRLDIQEGGELSFKQFLKTLSTK